MKKVVCIDDFYEHEDEGLFPPIKKGRIYHPIDIFQEDGHDYYILMECGNDNGYYVKCFIEIEDDNIDETELLEQREDSLVNS